MDQREGRDRYGPAPPARRHFDCDRSFARLVAPAGVRRIRFHDLWHTHATWLLAVGQPVKVVSKRLGHARVSITLDTYAHVLPGMQDGAADAIGEVLFRRGA